MFFVYKHVTVTTLLVTVAPFPFLDTFATYQITYYLELFMSLSCYISPFHFYFFIQKFILGILFFAVVILTCSSSLGQLQPLFTEADGPEIAPATSTFIYRLSRNEYFNKSFLGKLPYISLQLSHVSPEPYPCLFYNANNIQPNEHSLVFFI